MRTFSKDQTMFGVVLVLMLCGLWIISGIAQTTPPQSPTLPAWQVKVVGPRHLKRIPRPDTSAMSERVIENQIPSHIPIKVEIKNLEKEPLLRNIEVKVTNTSNKPIYYLDLEISLPELLSEAGNRIGFSLAYGRTGLISFNEQVRPEDVPLRAGESFVFKVPEERLTVEGRYADRVHQPLAGLKLIYLFFVQLNFGDKTGFVGLSGTRIPNIRKWAYSKRCLHGEDKAGSPSECTC